MKANTYTKFVLVVMVVLGLAESGRAQTWNIGPDGSNTVTATLSGGTLTVRGTGNMRDFSISVIPPWKSGYLAEDNSITKVVIEEGVTSIGIGAFNNCIGLNEVTIGNSVTSVKLTLK